MRVRQTVIGFAIVVAAVAVTACSGGSNPASPTGQSTGQSSAGSAVAGSASAASAPVVTPHRVAGSPNSMGVKDSSLSVKGAISQLAGSCSTGLTFFVGTIFVSTDLATVFEPSCASMVNGLVVEVRLIPQPDGSFKAAKVDAEEPDSDAGTVEVSGPVSALGGVCPTLTFLVGTIRVSTNASTLFEDGGCSDVANGVNVEVKGTPNPDGSITAIRVDLNTDNDHETEIDDSAHHGIEREIEGILTDLKGGCPSVTFKIGSAVVSTDAATKFEEGTCSSLANLVEVEVEGFVQPDGSVRASQIEIKDSSDHESDDHESANDDHDDHHDGRHEAEHDDEDDHDDR